MDSVTQNADVAEFFNAELGSDISNLQKLPEILQRLSEFEVELEHQVYPKSLDNTGASVCMKEAEEALLNIRELLEKCENLRNEAKKELESLQSAKDHFSTKIEHMHEVESMVIYLQWILKIEDENSRMESSLQNGTSQDLVESFMNFKALWEELRSSDCKNLVNYIQKTMLYWNGILLDKFGSEFQKILSVLHWPVLTTNLLLPASQSSDSISKFQKLFSTLCQIALPESHPKSHHCADNEDSSLLLPLKLMIQPLQKRFVFHFLSKKATNRLDKPEWYLTQILTWLSDHTMFIETIVQPVVDRENISALDMRIQFMQGLVQLAISRARSDLPSVLEDDQLLSHMIDEVLLFSQELRAQGYPSTCPGLVQILQSEPCFTRWRLLEHQSAIEKMDHFLSLDSAWKSRYQGESDFDEQCVPESAELFVTLLLTMTERYCHLTDKDSQLSFLQLQLELLDDFRLRLHQLSQSQIQESVQPDFCGIMNAVHYVTSVLEEWNNLPFFLHLYTYKEKKAACEELLKSSEKHPFHLHRPKESSEEDLLASSVFDDSIGLLRHMQSDLLRTMCEWVMLDIRAKSREYRKEKWFCVPMPPDKKLMEPTPSAFPMLGLISTGLCSLQDLLARPLFTRLWQQLAAELNVYLYEEVVLQNSFSEGGSMQLSFDMNRNLFPIFGAYTVKPENYFSLVKDSCTLLCLNSAAAMLLKETLKLEGGSESKRAALSELGVHTLSPSRALVILSQRTSTGL